MRVVGAYTLPVDTMVWVGNVIMVVAMGVGFLVSGALGAGPMAGMVIAEAKSQAQATVKGEGEKERETEARRPVESFEADLPLRQPRHRQVELREIHHAWCSESNGRFQPGVVLLEASWKQHRPTRSAAGSAGGTAKLPSAASAEMRRGIPLAKGASPSWPTGIAARSSGRPLQLLSERQRAHVRPYLVDVVEAFLLAARLAGGGPTGRKVTRSVGQIEYCSSPLTTTR